MDFAGSADIFQAEMGNLMASLKYARAYINDLLVITKGSLGDHLAKLEAVFIRLQDAGLKVNATKLFFCTAETEYPGYLLVGPGRYSGPISSTLEILITPPILTSPVNSKGTIVFSAPELV